MNTGLIDKNGKSIYTGDRTKLVLEDGEVREFEVCFKTVRRTMVKTLPGFEPETEKYLLREFSSAGKVMT